ncbi:MAG: long-chain-fatty-acid--CoA ligase [Pseudomonas stutzeri]|jgi:long-chain acyl-CoA synthetase|uniref:Long-chain-fatty-acid--CoA ligase n=1 Tax=Stutzerimonas stutzeri (strain ATCC 17588 / DSM 5190 / CCUG 11256 / JCM 5965 / LMG 11199 / NBRC 14165 / NCIMB 11358 / Stanier 221) TaxID=96563 RepID=F8H8B4_STUS2|nr:long-chain-fatty-acid--CoA ligase FadD2 [Stutzerimonas stutzeri]AEJ06283.1 long-chain-fatty-acid--CoA ligase [Stutzerimonas stutzeri]MBO0642586.1 long-chain-fatty-acid--CoA ligase FadD2 [Stutzerimonas stutzeri]MDH0120696.1 long-chain-fatty-acid--CoA ligase FadD2 [Stutzerimonas stutzeri]MTI93769.1 long-chain-fatty-acid--CoA ligase [Stutzerimonas stutzeri]OCX57658.1 long-chain fatty acid--CoA ligase [Stutzerimonas stutzeri]
MQPEFWNDKRPAGVPNDIDLAAYRSVVEVFERACKAHADRPAFSNMGVTLSYSDLERYSAAFAAWLQHHTDLQPGDRIAIQMPNLLQYPVAVFGALRAGLIVVNTNPLYTAREMRHQFQDSGARALVYLNTFGNHVQEVLADTVIEHLIEVQIGDMLPTLRGALVNAAVKHLKKMVPDYSLPQAVAFKNLLRDGARHSLKPTPLSLDDIAVLQYTGGTTGVAKGAMLTHGNLVANMQQVRANMQQLDAQGHPVIREGQEVMIAPLPLYHIYAFTVNCMCMMVTGNHNVLITNPRDINGFVKELQRWQFSAFLGLNTLFVALMAHPQFKKVDFSRLKGTNSGGTALVSAVAERWKNMTGCTVVEGYGLTETSPVVCANPHGEHSRLGTVGLPVPGTTLKVIDDEGNALPLGERGELCVKGPQVMKGYWQRPEATAEVLDEEGWLRTGDIAVIDQDGFVSIVDRKKDLIIVSGFNVYPNEIEDVVMAHPKVAACAAIGVADEKSGEAVKLFVVPSDPTLTQDELHAYCRENFTGYKMPRHYVFRDALPMTPVGKILRRELRESA